MRRIQTIPATILLAAMALQGCSGGGNSAREIAPGAFVRDEPIQIAQSKMRNSSRCVIDTVNGEKPNKKGVWTVQRGDGAAIAGWAHGKDGTEAGEQVFVRLTGSVQTYYAVTAERPMRADVNEYFKLPSELKIGFEMRATIDQVEPGIYSVAVLQALSGGVEICELPVTLVVN